jgi:transcriptional regulator with XRE-family HTH domain
MMIHGEIEHSGSMYGAVLEPLAMYGQGKTREAACTMLATTILEHVADHGPLDGFEVEVTDDGEATIYVTSNDPARLTALLLRRLRELHELSLADVTKAMNARSRNGWAQYEHGRIDPSLGKLQEMLAVVAPELTLAIIPRTARVIPRWDEEADDLAELDRVLQDPSPANVAALRARHVAHQARVDALRAELAARARINHPARATRQGPRAPTRRAASAPAARASTARREQATGTRTRRRASRRLR